MCLYTRAQLISKTDEPSNSTINNYKNISRLSTSRKSYKSSVHTSEEWEARSGRTKQGIQFFTISLFTLFDFYSWLCTTSIKIKNVNLK